MDATTRRYLEEIHSPDRDLQGAAYAGLLATTAAPVDWAYEGWDALVAALRDKDNRTRSIASQLLCQLAAKSDPRGRILEDFAALLAVTRDEKFVTARHCLQAIWQVGLAGPKQRRCVVDGLAGRFRECVSEKNRTLIRYDIVEGLRRLYNEVKDESIRQKAIALIETEADLKYRRKYLAVWK